MRFIGAILVFSIISSTLQDIIAYDPDDSTFYSRDIIQLNVSEIFDLSLAVGNVVFTPQSGNLVTKDTQFGVKDLSQFGFGSVDFVHFIDNQTYVSIFDETHILVHSVDLNGLSIVKEVRQDFSKPGLNTKCTDMDYNRDLSILYVACFNPAKEGDFGSINVLELDSSSGELLHSTKVPLTAQFLAQKALKIAIHTLQQGSTTQRFVVVYDQGISATSTTKNFWLAVFSGVDSGQGLQFVEFVDLRSLGFTLNSFFDAFNYNKKIVLTGYLESRQLISFVSCALQVTPLTLVCSDPSYTLVSNGYVGFMNTGQFVMVSLGKSKSYLQICDLEGPIETEQWKGCVTQGDIDFIPDTFVNEVVGNAFLVMVKYDHPDGGYAGYTVLSHTLSDVPEEWTSTDETLHATVINKQLHLVTTSKTYINSILPPSINFNPVGKYLAAGSLQWNCIASDSAGKTNTSTWNITVMDSINDEVSYNDSHLPDFAAYEGSSYDILLYSQSIEGNNLNYSVYFGNPSVQANTQTTVEDTVPLEVKFNFKTGSANFKDITFFDNYAVSIDQTSNLVFYTCDQYASLAVCNEIGNRLVKKGEVLMKRMFKVFGYAVTWTRNSTHTLVYFFSQDGSSFFKSFEGAATDFVVTVLDSDAFFLASYPESNNIQHFKMNVNSPSIIDYLDPITQSSSSSEFFCPKELYFCPNGANVLEVHSVCDNSGDNRLLKYTYWPGKYSFRLRNTIPIGRDLPDGQFCPMGSEFIISSESNSILYGSPTYWENATYNFGQEELKIGEFIKVDCVPTLRMFSIVSQDENHEKILSVYYGNNQYQANHRVYNVLRGKLSGVSDVTTHNFIGNMLHVLQMDDGSFSYMVSYAESPRISLKFLKGSGNVNTTTTITFSNDKHTYSIKKPLQVVVFNSTLNIMTKQNSLKKPFGLVDLEKYIDIYGVFVKAQIIGAGLEQAVVHQRVEEYKKYQPDYLQETTFQHIESSQGFNLALHSDNSNSASFTLFSNSDDFIIKFNVFPGVGVKGFSFSLIDSSSTSPKLLLAFCSDGQSDNFLEFIVAEEGVTSLAGRIPYFECSKVKLVPTKNGSDYLVVAHNNSDSSVAVFNVTLTSTSISTSLLDLYEDIASYGVAETSDSVHLLMTDSLSYMRIFQVEYGTMGVKTRRESRMQKDDGWIQARTYITSIECRGLADVHFTCVFDTYSPFMYEIVFTGDKFDQRSVYTYNKIPDHDGRYFVVTHSYFGVLTTTTRGAGSPDSWMIEVYKRAQAGGDGNAYGFVPLEARGPFTIVERKDGSVVMAHCTDKKAVPLRFSKISTLQIEIKDSALNFSQALLELGNLEGTARINLQAVFSPEADVKNPVKPLFFFLLLAALIVLAIVYNVYSRIKQDSSNLTDSQKYASIEDKQQI